MLAGLKRLGKDKFPWPVSFGVSFSVDIMEKGSSVCRIRNAGIVGFFDFGLQDVEIAGHGALSCD